MIHTKHENKIILVKKKQKNITFKISNKGEWSDFTQWNATLQKSQISEGVAASGQIVVDGQISIRCQTSRDDEVYHSPLIQLLLRYFWKPQSHRTVTQSELSILSDLVNTNGPSSAWIHTFFMNLLLKSLIMLIKYILGPLFLYPILLTVQEALFKTALHWIKSSHCNELFY